MRCICQTNKAGWYTGLAMLMLLWHTGCAASRDRSTAEPMPMPADNINTAEVINVTAGREFAIVLPANPTTGYQWSLARAPDHVTVVPVTNIYIPKETARRLVGAGGEERWTFRALAPGRTRLTLHYARPWEKDSAPHDVRNYTVNVDAGSAGR